MREIEGDRKKEETEWKKEWISERFMLYILIPSSKILVVTYMDTMLTYPYIQDVTSLDFHWNGVNQKRKILDIEEGLPTVIPRV